MRRMLGMCFVYARLYVVCACHQLSLECGECIERVAVYQLRPQETVFVNKIGGAMRDLNVSLVGAQFNRWFPITMVVYTILLVFEVRRGRRWCWGWCKKVQHGEACVLAVGVDIRVCCAMHATSCAPCVSLAHTSTLPCASAAFRPPM